MRAGGFAELRVIRLLNRRFVSFYFNTGGPGLGKDAHAAGFVLPKVKNKFAHWAGFTPKGEYLGEAAIYADKDQMFAYLVALLRNNPEFDRMTAEEKAVLDIADKSPGNALAQKEAGVIHEDLGRYAQAVRCYQRILAADALAETKSEAYRALMRIARHEKRWADVQVLAEQAAKENLAGLAADIAMERGYLWLSERRYADLRLAMEKSIREHPRHPRMGEFRFYAGVACFFLNDIDRASYHWVWVVENIPDDHMQRRCYIAAAHRGMPYPNPELGGFQSKHKGGNIQVIQAAYSTAQAAYRRIVAAEKK